MTEGGIIIIILAAELRERPGGGGFLSYFPFSFIFFFYKQLLKIPGNYSNCCAEKKKSCSSGHKLWTAMVLSSPLHIFIFMNRPILFYF